MILKNIKIKKSTASPSTGLVWATLYLPVRPNGNEGRPTQVLFILWNQLVFDSPCAKPKREGRSHVTKFQKLIRKKCFSYNHTVTELERLLFSS